MRFDNDKKLLAEAALAIRQHGTIERAFRAIPANRTDLRGALEFMARTARMPQPGQQRPRRTIKDKRT
jgi:hypothetical protein